MLTNLQLLGKYGIMSIGADLSGATSVTRFGDLLDFGQLFKAFGNN